MGATSTVIVLDHPERGRPKIHGRKRLHQLGRRGDWRLYYLDRLVAPKELDILVRNWSKEGSRAVIAYFVEDSDLAYVVGAKDGTYGFRVLLNPSMARMYSEGKEALEILEARGELFNEEGAKDLANWTSNTPMKASAEEIAKVLQRKWVLAEEGARNLLEIIGLKYPT